MRYNLNSLRVCLIALHNNKPACRISGPVFIVLCIFQLIAKLQTVFEKTIRLPHDVDQRRITKTGASNTPHTVNSVIELHVCCGAQVVVTIQVILVIPSFFFENGLQFCNQLSLLIPLHMYILFLNFVYGGQMASTPDRPFQGY
jgi:hypothetical protein